MRKIPSLKSLQAFEAAARRGSFLMAADELFLTPSAISHQIRQLEDYLAVKLFHRTHRSIELTDTGRRYAEQISEAFNQIQAATRDIGCTSKSDILTIQSTPSFATQWLMPRLARFSALYSDIDIRLNASMEVADINAGEADMAIRYGDVFPDRGVAMELLPEEHIVVLCQPKWLEEQGGVDLKQHALIHSEVNVYQWRDWGRDHHIHDLPLTRGPRFDRSFMAINAAADGLGVALESMLMAERELVSGRLVMPFGQQSFAMNTHKLLYAKSKANTPKIVAFREWLYQELYISRRNLARLWKRPRTASNAGG